MNRRGFLGGLLALAAPAVITTPGLLMPVSTFALPTYGRGGILTPDMIGREFSRILQGMVTRKVIPGTEDHKQTGVSFPLNSHDLTLSMEDFAKRHLLPAAAMACENVGDGSLSIGRIMEMPEHLITGAMVERNGVFARAVIAYDIFEDTTKMRLDVLHT